MRAEQRRLDSSRAEQIRLKPDQIRWRVEVDQSTQKQIKVYKSRLKQNKADQSRPKQIRAYQSRPKQTKADAQSIPNQAIPHQNQPSAPPTMQPSPPPSANSTATIHSTRSMTSPSQIPHLQHPQQRHQGPA